MPADKEIQICVRQLDAAAGHRRIQIAVDDCAAAGERQDVSPPMTVRGASCSAGLISVFLAHIKTPGNVACSRYDLCVTDQQRI